MCVYVCKESDCISGGSRQLQQFAGVKLLQHIHRPYIYGVALYQEDLRKFAGLFVYVCVVTYI